MRAAAWRTAAFAGALVVGYSAKATAAGATWFGMRGPFCPIGTCFGSLACPGCGLLRSTAAALQGDLSLAFACHPAGPVVAALLWLGLLLHLDLLRRGREARWHRPAFTAGVLSFTISVIFGWLVRIGTAT